MYKSFPILIIAAKVAKTLFFHLRKPKRAFLLKSGAIFKPEKPLGLFNILIISIKSPRTSKKSAIITQLCPTRAVLGLRSQGSKWSGDVIKSLQIPTM